MARRSFTKAVVEQRKCSATAYEALTPSAQFPTRFLSPQHGHAPGAEAPYRAR